jgi:outer membrane protein assembly factor BamB
MKIQCPCGAKYSVDVTPEMAGRPVKFVCQSCGLDSSDAVNAMIRQLFSQPAQAIPTGILVSAAAEVPKPEAPPAPPPSTRIRLSTATSSQAAAPAEAAATAEAPQLCLKHAGEPMIHECLVCKKPMCAKCMETFGYICSPFCKTKAENQRLVIPEYAGQRSVADAHEWRKIGSIAGGIAALILGLIGFWIWYAWVGSVPKPMYSVKFTEAAGSGKCQVSEKTEVVFLHGYTLARHDLKTKKEVWSHDLVDRKAIKDAVAERMKAMPELTERLKSAGLDAPGMPSPEDMIESMMDSAGSQFQLHVLGSNIWVATPGALVRYDWDTGKPVQTIPALGEPVRQGDDLMVVDENDSGGEIVTHVNLATTESRVEELGSSAALANDGGKDGPALKGAALGGLPTSGPLTAMDPAKVAAQAQKLPLAAKIALPAVLAANANQQRALAEMSDEDHPRKAFDLSPHARGYGSFMPSQYGHVNFSAKLLEERMVQRKAMKDPPKKSALDGAVNVTQSLEVANEILNDIQRLHGADTVTEDESRYQVTIRLPGVKAPDWSMEVVGPPSLYPLKTVNLLATGHELIALDKANKKLWQSPLTYRVPERAGTVEEDGSPYGFGPAVERDGVLFVFDQAVLTAFEPATGKVLWRLPSVGVAGLFFDEKGMLYVNTTTASPDSIKYSRQIDVTQRTSSIILKVDPRSGKTLWSASPGGYISKISGKFIYIVRSSYGSSGGFPGLSRDESPFLKIKRLNPDNGKVMWEYLEQRVPIDVQFNRNMIQVVFDKEVEVLKFLSF